MNKILVGFTILIISISTNILDNLNVNTQAKKSQNFKRSNRVDEKEGFSDKKATAPEGMVYVNAGTFKMGNKDGASDAKPVHTVYVNSFYIDKHEVTVQEFTQFLNEKGNQTEGGNKWLDIKDWSCPIKKEDGHFIPKDGKANHPIVEVSWYGAKSYAEWVGKRLPTEAEWEYAAKGGHKAKDYKFSGSDNPREVAWYDANSDSKTHPVGSLKPNELGIYDMSGNVWEWCQDWYKSDYYENSPRRNPTGPEEELQFKLLRGGAWVSIAEQLTPTIRDFAYPYNAYYLNGFRCVKDAQ